MIVTEIQILTAMNTKEIDKNAAILYSNGTPFS